jgi:hypothetical protein
MKLYMFRTVHLSIIRSLFTLHSAMVHVIQVCKQLSSRSRMELQFHPDSAWKRSSYLHETYQCRMYSRKLLMMDREDARNM